MLVWSIKISIISFIFICLVHHIFTFLKNTLTPPKTKDLVNFPAKYNTLYSTNSEPKYNQDDDPPHSSATNITDLPTDSEQTSMKNQLKDFLKGRV